jgi:hypothetical protein
MRETRNVHRIFFAGNPNIKDDLGELGVDGRILLKWIFDKWNIMCAGRAYLP